MLECSVFCCRCKCSPHCSRRNKSLSSGEMSCVQHSVKKILSKLYFDKNNITKCLCSPKQWCGKMLLKQNTNSYHSILYVSVLHTFWQDKYKSIFTGFVCTWLGCLLIGNVIMISVAVGSKSEMSIVNRSLCFHRPQKEACTSAQLSSCDLKCPIILTKTVTRGQTSYKLHINLQFWVCVNHLKTHLRFLSTVTNKKPSHVSITKVKQFQGSSAFIKRSQWTVDQLRQVNGIDPNKVCNF